MNSLKKIIFVVLSCLIKPALSQQADNDFRFYFNDSTIVTNNINQPLELAWLGGLNTPQFSSIDINLDGKKDLFIFERNGNKIYNLINTSASSGEIKLKNSIDYLNRFPVLHDWALLTDFNGDQKEDIFTYSSGGIAVYKNTSTTTALKFTQITNSLLADFGTGNMNNIYVSSVDIPAFVDIDKDGDLDILSFHILGSYLQLYINLSMEKYGNADSLDYVLANNCWGSFAESENANKIILNINCPYSKLLNDFTAKATRHTGSTISAIDLNNDSNIDLLIGDIDFRNMYALYANSTGSDAIINQYDSIFPNYDTTINITSMPAAYFVDVNNDGKKDLVVAPDDPRVSDTYKGICWYENIGTGSANIFKYKEKGFLQNDMIDIGQHSYPMLYDYDKDGLTDLLVSNYGTYSGSKDSLNSIYSYYYSRIYLYKNIGSNSNPSFKAISDDVANLSSLKTIGLFPTFGDLNNDGKDELILGDQNGKLHYLENISNDINIPNFQHISASYSNIDIGNYSSPQLLDLNRDGLLDLVVGAKDGKLYYFQNTGTTSNPVFSNTPTISKLGNVVVTDTLNSNFGYSKPFFYDLNGSYRLMVGSQSGNFFYYSSIDNNLNGSFELVNPSYLSSNFGAYSSITMKDINNDTYPEAIIGNEAGGLNFFKGAKPWGVGIKEEKNSSVKIYPNPCSNSFSIENAEILKIELINLEGQTIQTFNKNATEYFFNESVSNGVYTLKIELNNHQILYSKLIKVKP
ncbi:MAG: T9SS type A sorting domain-containing protein [Bacteroidota bacterium]